MIDSILSKTSANVVVGFLTLNDMINLQHQLVIRGNNVRHITWLLAYPYDLETDRFIIGGSSDIRSFKGSLAIKPEETVPEDFKQQFKSLTSDNNERNPWFKEMAYPNDCNQGIDSCIDTHGQLVPGIIDAVKVIANGIDKLMKRKCPQTPSGMCAEFLSASPDEFREAVRDYTFTRADNTFFAIRDDLAILPTFEVWNYKDVNGEFKYDKVCIFISRFNSIAHRRACSIII